MSEASELLKDLVMGERVDDSKDCEVVRLAREKFEGIFGPLRDGFVYVSLDGDELEIA